MWLLIIVLVVVIIVSAVMHESFVNNARDILFVDNSDYNQQILMID
jgi:hypothetical protein